MRRAWIALTPLLVAGCAPTGIVVASYAADGASYAATGKSVEDHAVSTVKDEDCATYRVFTGGVICRDPQHPPPKAPLEVRNGSSASPPVAVVSPQPEPGSVPSPPLP